MSWQKIRIRFGILGMIFCFFGLGASLIDQLVKGGDEFCCVAIETVITAMLNFEGGQLGLGREEIKVL